MQSHFINFLFLGNVSINQSRNPLPSLAQERGILCPFSIKDRQETPINKATIHAFEILWILLEFGTSRLHVLRRTSTDDLHIRVIMP